MAGKYWYSNFFRIVIAGIFFWGLFGGMAAAQEVTVTGIGADREGALRDASRRAVEQVAGTFISSQTMMKNLAIQLDEVYKKSQGFVKRVTVLNEGAIGANAYKVVARIDVDTDPDARLMDELTMIMRLYDPRIVVVVLEKDETGQVVHNNLAESTLNDKLVKAGFSHVLDAAQVSSLQNAALMKSIYDGKRGELAGENDKAADFLVVGNCMKDISKVSIPKYKESGMLETGIVSGKAVLAIEVISYNTGKIFGTFTVEGTGLDNSDVRAKDKAVAAAVQQAADRLLDTFKSHSAKNVQGLEITLTADSEDKLQQVIQALRSLGNVDNIYIREQGENKAVLTIDSAYRPHEIIRQLKNSSSCGIAVESLLSDSCQLRIT